MLKKGSSFPNRCFHCLKVGPYKLWSFSLLIKRARPYLSLFQEVMDSFQPNVIFPFVSFCVILLEQGLF